MKIKCDSKEYDIPKFQVGDWEKIIISYDKFMAKSEVETLLSPEGIKEQVEFYYLLLHDAYPELTRNKLRKMPLYQLGMEFTGMLFTELMKVPLGLELANENEA